MKAAFAMLALVAGCTGVFPANESTDREDTACDVPRYQGMIGHPSAVLNTVALPPATRIIRPGTVVTMDYNPVRLNIGLDAQERITRVWCG